MSLSLSATYTAIAPGRTSSFLGVSGVEPYVYSIVAGGNGGTINSSTGVYTAPSTYGIDTVLVTDALAATAELAITTGTALILFCDILQESMNLSQGQVIIFDQKFNIPTDSRLYIAVGVRACKPFGNSTKMVDGVSMQSVNMAADLDINILSRSTEALNRKEEVILALQSQYAEAQQEANSFYVSQLSHSFVNLSEIDGGAIPYRYVIGARLQYFVSKQLATSYFDTFQTTEVITNS